MTETMLECLHLFLNSLLDYLCRLRKANQIQMISRTRTHTLTTYNSFKSVYLLHLQTLLEIQFGWSHSTVFNNLFISSILPCIINIFLLKHLLINPAAAVSNLFPFHPAYIKITASSFLLLLTCPLILIYSMIFLVMLEFRLLLCNNLQLHSYLWFDILQWLRQHGDLIDS